MKYSLVVLLALLVSATLSETAQAAQVTNLSVEYRRNPLGVDVAHPRLSWNIVSDVRGERQSAYQVLVASTPELLAKNQGDLWNSAQITSDQSIYIKYGGKPLNSAQQVFWKVRTWNGNGQPSAWSTPAQWTMGILRLQDWQAKWISATPYKYDSVLLRKDMNVKAGLRRAVAFVCGLGHYEMTLNGAKVGNDLLAPGWTKYNKTCLYDTHDITSQLKPGANTVGLFLGNGMYNVPGGRYSKFIGSFGPLKAIAQIRLQYSDGTTQTVGTDGTWQVSPGPVTFSDVYGGEDYDARLEQRGWNQPGFNASSWSAARVSDGPGGALKGLSVANPPIRAFEVLKPIGTKPLNPRAMVYDMGQNAAIIPRLTVKGPSGSTIRLIPAEMLKPDGSVDQTSTGGPSYWQYTLAGNGSEHYFSPFFYRGCRYLQVEVSAPAGGALPIVELLENVVVHADSPAVGTFSTSNALFNRIHPLVRWAQTSNMVSVMTDCPHREKLGWLEENHLNGPALRHNFDMSAMFAKMMNDIADSQLDNGMVPTTAPEYPVFGGDFRDSPEWGSALLMVAWQQHEFNGDDTLLRNYYEPMKRYVAYLGSRANNNIVSHGLSDWYDIGPGEPGYSKLTPKGLTATAFYYQDTVVVAKTAGMLGLTDEATKYEQLAEQIRVAFNAKFFNAASHQYATGSQAANAIPLVMGMVDPAHRVAVVDNIVRNVQENGLTAGDVGYRYLLRALADGGRSDVIYAMNNQTEKPGYGYQLKRGATSLTEAWDAHASSSQNHFMLGQINEWFYHDLAGIQSDPTGPGFKKIIIKPAIVGDLASAQATYRSGYGTIRSRWKRVGSQITLNVTIPANTTATVYVPSRDAAAVKESGQPATHVPGVKYLRRENGAAVFEVLSGSYSFTGVTGS